jgi:enamine deaminase RidA (YjgF/YER057c/UK114 family)
MPSIVNPPELAPPRGYSNGLLYESGRILFVAGQIGWDKGGRVVSPEFDVQFEQALRNVLDVVAAAGGQPSSVARLTIFATDKKKYLAALKPVGARYRALMGNHYPAMTLVEVKSLLHDEALVEIEATAVIP